MNGTGLAENSMSLIIDVCDCFSDCKMTSDIVSTRQLSTVMATHVVSPCTQQVDTVALTNTPSSCWCNTTPITTPSTTPVTLADREIIVYSVFIFCIGLCVLFGLIVLLSCLYIKKKTKKFTPHGELYVNAASHKKLF